ncbi:unnamed protein product, partial [Chrysoparadoxa australica]
VPTEILTKYGVKLNDAVLAEEKHMPLYQEMVDSFAVSYIAGGATQNSIRVAQWMSKTPGLTAFMGCVGKDAFGDKLANCAKDDGVDVHYMISQDTPTGTCAVLVNGGERSLVANLAAANKFTADHLETAHAKELIEAAKIYYIAGFFLTVSMDSLLAVAKHAASANKTFCMNLSAPFLIDFFGDQMAQALPYTDYVFANESEAAAFGAKQGWGNDIKEVAAKLAAMPKENSSRSRTVVFTQGSESTIVFSDGKLQEFAVDELPSEKLVDTNGAGDAFVGGFLAMLQDGKDLAKCVDAGHAASRVIIQRSGCTFPGIVST